MLAKILCISNEGYSFTTSVSIRRFPGLGDDIFKGLSHKNLTVVFSLQNENNDGGLDEPVT